MERNKYIFEKIENKLDALSEQGKLEEVEVVGVLYLNVAGIPFEDVEDICEHTKDELENFKKRFSFPMEFIIFAVLDQGTDIKFYTFKKK